jgi:cytoskeleton protein RodZ
VDDEGQQMTDAASDAVAAGLRLRQARESAGYALEVMAGMLKVPPARLAALEDARLDELPDLAFARALAQAHCRLLHVDPVEVLALLPRPDPVGRRLEHVNAGLGGRSGTGPLRPKPTASFRSGRRPWPRLVWGLLAVVVVVALWAAGLGRLVFPDGGSAPSGLVAPSAAGEAVGSGAVAGDAAGASGATGSVGSGPAAASPAPVVPSSERQGGGPVPAAGVSGVQGGMVAAGWTLAATAPAWVRVADAQDRPLLERTLSAGETVVLDRRRPLRLELGNASASVLMDNGRQVDLAPWTRDNVASLVLE